MKTLHAYILGFVLSIVLTLLAFWVTSSSFETSIILVSLVSLAVGQLLVQLILFLHLGSEPKPKWNVLAFLFALFVVTVVVGGSLWIMNHLHHEEGEVYNVFEEENIPPPNYAE